MQKIQWTGPAANMLFSPELKNQLAIKYAAKTMIFTGLKSSTGNTAHSKTH